MATVQLYGRQGCHLCQDAVDRLTALAGPAGVGWTYTDVDDDPELRAEWGDMVPVLLVGERVVDWGALSEATLRAALVPAHDS